MPQVSVIIPNYNHAPYLKQRIDSILNQSYQDFEIIILDDCSPDNSREIIEQYRGHSKVRQIIYNETNGGTTFKQWDKGINLAKGKYIWIAESDDWCKPDLLKTLINGIEKNDQCVLAYAQSYVVDNDLNILWMSAHTRLGELINGLTFIKNYMLVKNSVFNASMAIFKKDIYSSIPKEFINFKFCGDWLFWIEVAKKGDVCISGLHLNFFRKHIKNVSGNAVSSGLNFIEELKILNILKDDNTITAQEYNCSLLPKYDAYRTIKPTIEIKMRGNIENGFYNNRDTKFLLKRDYYKRVSAKTINKSVNFLIRKLF